MQHIYIYIMMLDTFCNKIKNHSGVNSRSVTLQYECEEALNQTLSVSRLGLHPLEDESGPNVLRIAS